MSSAIASLSAAPSVQRSARPAERASGAETPVPGSFGEALSRASQSADEPAAKPRDKASASPTTRRQDGPRKDAEEPAEPTLLAGLALMALDARTPPRPHGSATAAALTSDASQPATADPQALGSALLPELDAAALPGTDIDLNFPAESALVAALASPFGRERGPPAVNTRKEAAPLVAPAGAPAGTVTDAAQTATLRKALETPVLEASMLRSADFKATGASNKKPVATPALVPAATDAVAGQAGNHTQPQLEALIASMSTSGFTEPASGAETGTVAGMTGATAQLPENVDSISLDSPALTPALSQDVGSSEWGEALGQQLLHMGKAGQESAELQLNPPGLGPLKITLSMNDHQIQAAFVSAHASVRAAVEAALPQLRAAMADNGINLGDASVGAESRQPPDAGQGQERRPGQGSYPGMRARELAGGPERAIMEPRRQEHGAGVDIYA
jgi:flagellar hook-length control protein FliK